MNGSCAHIVVSGLVQGVGYRYFASRRAEKLGLTGYARNLPDGRVEILACGEDGLIAEFVKLLGVGPAASSVRDIALEWVKPGETFDRFEIR
jgi:acylphosphatase